MTLRLQGALTALVTPFTEDGAAIDWQAHETLVQTQLEAGISGLVPCGTTGETPTLSADEQAELIRRTKAIAAGQVPVVAGAGSNDTRKSIASAQAAVAAGADAVMIAMPYYNKPSQAGMFRHVELIAKAIDAPLVLYNIPGRSAVELSVDTLVSLLEALPNIVAVKDATGNVNHCQDLLSRVGDRVSVLSGDDPLTLPMMSVGARGVISVTSNVLPKEVAEVPELVMQGDWEAARRAHFRLLPVHRALFIEPNPQPVKAALEARGKIQGVLRPPMLPASPACREGVAAALIHYEAT